jgi:hypothetical protein
MAHCDVLRQRQAARGRLEFIPMLTLPSYLTLAALWTTTHGLKVCFSEAVSLRN